VTDVLAVTGPIYLIIAVGWAVTRAGLFERADMRVFGRFVLQLALPALLFNALWQRPVAQVLNPVFMAAFAGASLLLAAAGLAWARLVGKKSLSAAAVVAMGMTCGNNGFVGFPLALQLIGPAAAPAIALCLVIESVLMLPLLMAIGDIAENRERREGHPWRHAVMQSAGLMLRNPMILAIAAGLAFSLLGLRLPLPVTKAVDLLALSSGGLALFVIGGSLVGLRTSGLWADVGAVAVGKLVLLPLLVLGGLWLLPPLAPALHTAAVLAAAVPMLGVYSVLAQKHGHDRMAAAAQLATTVASFFTLTGLLWLLRQGWLG
jgi:malonate transporter